VVECKPKDKFGEERWKLVNCLIEAIGFKHKSFECWRKVVNSLIKATSSDKNNKSGRKVVDWVIESISNSEMSESRREIINWLVEKFSKNKMGESGGEVIDWVVEALGKCEMSEAWWKIVYWFIEPPRSGQSCHRGGKFEFKKLFTICKPFSGITLCCVRNSGWEGIKWLVIGGSGDEVFESGREFIKMNWFSNNKMGEVGWKRRESLIKIISDFKVSGGGWKILGKHVRLITSN
jgi:hypothetical protein